MVTVSRNDDGQRIDNFLLREIKGAPRSFVYRILRRGEVRVDGRRAKPVYRLKAGESVRIPPMRGGDASGVGDAAIPEGWRKRLSAAVIHEDADLLVINKPANLAVHGGSGVPWGVIEAFRVIRPDLKHLELVHRLDRGTSGVLVMAKRRNVLKELHEKFRGRDMEKVYVCLLSGALPRGPVPVEAKLARDQVIGGERMVRASVDGKESRTVFKARQRWPGLTLAEAVIGTGRTHQIRVHAAHIGHPVVGDDKYGDRDVNKVARQKGCKRMFLHAEQLAFSRDDGRDHRFCAPLPPELADVLNKLEAGE